MTGLSSNNKLISWKSRETGGPGFHIFAKIKIEDTWCIEQLERDGFTDSYAKSCIEKNKLLSFESERLKCWKEKEMSPPFLGQKKTVFLH